MKQDLRITKTYKALCDTFMQMLTEKRFEEITIHDLCDRALVRRATFYNHFADKYDFFSFYVKEIRKEIEVLPADDPSFADPRKYLTFLFRQFILFLEQHQKMVESLLSSTALPTLINILTLEIRSSILLFLVSQKEKGASFNVSVEVLSSFFSGGIIQIVFLLVNSDSEENRADIIHNFELMLEHLDFSS